MTATDLSSTAALDGVLRVPGSPELPVPVLVRHDAREPEALRVVIALDDDTACEWLLDRAAVTAGLAGGSGSGVVAVAVVEGRAQVRVGDLATLLLPLAPLVELLCATYAVAPTGGAEMPNPVEAPDTAAVLAQA